MNVSVISIYSADNTVIIRLENCCHNFDAASEDIEKSDDGDDGQRRGANTRRSDGIYQRIGLIRDSDASWRNTRSSFSREALRGSWVSMPLDQRPKTSSHQKRQENWLQHIKVCSISSPWCIYEFLYNAHTNFFISFITGFCIDVKPNAENPIPERSGSVSDELHGTPLQKPVETENKNGREEVRSDLLHDFGRIAVAFQSLRRRDFADEESLMFPNTCADWLNRTFRIDPKTFLHRVHRACLPLWESNNSESCEDLSRDFLLFFREWSLFSGFLFGCSSILWCGSFP